MTQGLEPLARGAVATGLGLVGQRAESQGDEHGAEGLLVRAGDQASSVDDQVVRRVGAGVPQLDLRSDLGQLAQPGVGGVLRLDDRAGLLDPLPREGQVAPHERHPSGLDEHGCGADPSRVV